MVCFEAVGHAHGRVEETFMEKAKAIGFVTYIKLSEIEVRF